MNRISRALTVSTILLVDSSIALASDDFEPFFELLVMGGVSTLDAEDASMIMSASETDLLTQTNDGDWESWTGQLGVGYVYPLAEDLETGDVQWFSLINPQINLYYLDGDTIEGDVYQYQSADFNFLDYTMDYHSTRLMFDLGITVASIDGFSIYAIGGLGLAWNEIDFLATPNQLGLDCGVVGYNLNSQSSTSFAYEFGGGITAAVNDDIAISLEYLYTGFTDVELGNNTDSDFDIQNSDLDINSQSVLLGLRFAL